MKFIFFMVLFTCSLMVGCSPRSASNHPGLLPQFGQVQPRPLVKHTP